MGKTIAGLGITGNHVQVMFIVLFILALTWNWVLNLVAHLTGQRLTCVAQDKEKKVCGQLTQRSRGDKNHKWVYTCACGHRRTTAHFHPIKKGVLANSLLAVSLMCCMMFYIR